MSSTDDASNYENLLDPATSTVPPPKSRRRRDDTRRAQASEAKPAGVEAETLTREVQQLQAVADSALAHLALPDLLQALLERLQYLMEVDNAAILLLEEDGQHLLLHAAHGPGEAEVGRLRVPLGHGVTGRIAAARTPLVVDDLASVEVVYPRIQEAFRSVVGVPMLVGQRLVGVVCVSSTPPRHFVEADVQLLQKAADRMALPIDRARLYVAEQRAREQAQLSEHYYQRLVEANLIGIAVSDGERILEANGTFLRLLGYTQEDVQAGRLRRDTLTTADTYALAERTLQEAVATGASKPFERAYVRQDGTQVSVLVAPVLLQREPLRFVNLVLDLTEQKRLAQERQTALAGELAAQQVAEQMSAFLATAAHDIRQPVTVASARVQMAERLADRLAAALRQQPPTLSVTAESPRLLAAEVLESLQRAQVGMQTLRRLVNVLFDVTQAQAQQLVLELAAVDLRALVEETVTAQQAATDGHRLLLVTGPPEAVWVEGDADRLDEVLTNFLTNALKYAPADQPVTVRLEVVDHQAVVSVTDHGPGIPPEEQHRIWEMFYRSPQVSVQPGNRAAKGSLGLGLSICKRLVELHPGGRIGVESEVGHGATFWFQLPLAS